MLRQEVAPSATATTRISEETASHFPKGSGSGVFNLSRFSPVLCSWNVTIFVPHRPVRFPWVRWLDAALAVPFFLSAPSTAIVQNAKLTPQEIGLDK
jgi:hypothetical protein